MLSNNHKNVKGVKGMLRVQIDTLNTLKANDTNRYRLHVKHVKGSLRVRARVEKFQQCIIRNIIDIKIISTREIYTLNILNGLTKPYTASLSDVKGVNRTLNTLNISKFW